MLFFFAEVYFFEACKKGFSSVRFPVIFYGGTKHLTLSLLTVPRPKMFQNYKLSEIEKQTAPL